MKRNCSNDICDIKRRIQEGDAQALSILYKSYFKKLKYYGLSLVQPSNLLSLDDIIQDLFLWIAGNPTKLIEVSNLEVYLFVSLKRNIFNKLSLQKSKEDIKVRYDLYQKKEAPIEPSVEQKYINKESQKLHQTAANTFLNQLPPNQKQVLYLRNYVNLSYKQIAEIMNLSEQVVRNYAFRALSKLRKNAKGKTDLDLDVG